MSQLNTSQSSDKDRNDSKNAVIATALLIALFGLSFFAPRNDPSKVIAGIPCSVISENAIASVVGSPVRLMPTNGTTCEYVPTGSSAQRSVFVIAHQESLTAEYRSIANGVHVRNGTRTYTIIVVPQKPDADSYHEEARLAHLMSFGTAVAQNR